MVPLTALAVWFADREHPTAGGVAVGFATLAKQVAAITIAPVAYKAWERDRQRGVAHAMVGAAAPVVLAALWYGPGRFVFWVFTDSNGYLDPTASIYVSAERFVVWTALFVAANLGAVLLLRSAWARRRDDIDLWLWAAGAVVGVAAGLRFFGHYYLQLAPPLVLLAVGTLARSSIVTWVRTGALALRAWSCSSGLKSHPVSGILRRAVPFGQDAFNISRRPVDHEKQSRGAPLPPSSTANPSANLIST